MVTHNDIGKQIKVTALFGELPAACRDFAGQTGELVAIRTRGCLMSCKVSFGDHFVGGFLPTELEVVK